MERKLYEIWLNADGEHHDRYAKPHAKLETLCNAYSCTISGIVEDDPSRVNVELTEECKEALIQSDLLDELPVAGQNPAIFEAGTVVTVPVCYKVGLTA